MGLLQVVTTFRVARSTSPIPNSRFVPVRRGEAATDSTPLTPLVPAYSLSKPGNAIA